MTNGEAGGCPGEHGALGAATLGSNLESELCWTRDDEYKPCLLLAQLNASKKSFLTICEDVGLASLSYDTHRQEEMCSSWGVSVPKPFPGLFQDRKQSTLSRKIGKQIKFLCVLCLHLGTERELQVGKKDQSTSQHFKK